MAQKSFLLSVLSRLVMAFVLFGFLLFIPAGTLNWQEAWAFIIILLCYGVLLHFLLLKDNPKLQKSRSTYKTKLTFDSILMFFASIFFFAMMILIGLDVGRLHWTSLYVIPLVKYLGFALMVCALVEYMFVMKENTYLSRIVEIQEGHKIITTGPYSYVRHPMYFGNVLFVLSLPLALGSFLALIPGILFLLLFIPRILFEEKTLMKEFADYKDYMQKVRYRVIPNIW